MAYTDVRGPDGRLLFKFDPERLVIQVQLRGVMYTIDLTQYRPKLPVVIETDPEANGRARDAWG